MHDFKRTAKIGRQQNFRPALAFRSSFIRRLSARTTYAASGVSGLWLKKKLTRQIEQRGNRANIGKRRFGLATLDLRQPADRPVKPRGKIVQRPVARPAICVNKFVSCDATCEAKSVTNKNEKNKHIFI
jgi:hypothetical protein